jgi:hypothetical protein
MMNVDQMHGKPMNLDLIRAIFNKAHRYFSAGLFAVFAVSTILLTDFDPAPHPTPLLLTAGLRMYYFCIPLFAWTFSAYALLAVCPLYVYMVHGFESLEFMKDELQASGFVVDEDVEGEVVEIGHTHTSISSLHKKV